MNTPDSPSTRTIAILVAGLLDTVQAELRSRRAREPHPANAAATEQALAAVQDARRELPELLARPATARECELFAAVHSCLAYALTALRDAAITVSPSERRG